MTEIVSPQKKQELHKNIAATKQIPIRKENTHKSNLTKLFGKSKLNQVIAE
jgi:hypothetical protein